jgi:hypothetical protein
MASLPRHDWQTRASRFVTTTMGVEIQKSNSQFADVTLAEASHHPAPSCRGFDSS